MPVGWTILAVIAAGMAGTLANSAVVAALTPNPFGALATRHGRLGVAVAVAVLLPAIYALTSGAGAAVAAIVALTVIPSMLARFVFGIGAPRGFVLSVNAVDAVTE
jgi:hypothetical protein